MGEPDIGNYVIMLQGMKRTGGSETSQYPEEKKSTEISQVAASEREGGQTDNLLSGLRIIINDSKRIVERFWNSRAKRVKLP